MASVPSETEVRILVVDDNASIRTLLSRLLATEGYDVEAVADAETAIERVGEADLLLLDIMMAGQDGLDLLRTIRETSDVPVILLTAKASEGDRVLGLRLGADDYITKPFSTAELSARIAAVLRRTTAGGHQHEAPTVDGLQVDRARRQVTVRGEIVDMPAKEYELLAFLAASPGETFTREELLERIWNRPGTDDPATVTEHVRRLRLRIEDDPARPRWIRTVRGTGYRFDG